MHDYCLFLVVQFKLFRLLSQNEGLRLLVCKVQTGRIIIIILYLKKSRLLLLGCEVQMQISLVTCNRLGFCSYSEKMKLGFGEKRWFCSKKKNLVSKFLKVKHFCKYVQLISADLKKHVLIAKSEYFSCTITAHRSREFFFTYEFTVVASFLCRSGGGLYSNIYL